MREEVIREVLLPASAEEVWKALTEPGRLAEWLAEDAEIELCRGGDVRFRLAGGRPADRLRRLRGAALAPLLLVAAG